MAETDAKWTAPTRLKCGKFARSGFLFGGQINSGKIRPFTVAHCRHAAFRSGVAQSQLESARSKSLTCARASAGPVALLEQLLRCNRQAIGDVGRAVGNLKHMVAERAAKLALPSDPRGKLDPPEAGMALGTNDVASFHGVTLCRTTMTVRRRPHRALKTALTAREPSTRVATATPRLFRDEEPHFRLHKKRL